MLHRIDRDIRDAIHDAFGLAHASRSDRGGIVGYGIAHLYEGNIHDGTKLIVPFGNLITDAGDLYAAGKVITGISPANPSAPTAASGMKLGTGSTAASKTDAGCVTYETGSNNPFDASFPATVNLGSTLGVNAQYKTTWAAGDVTEAALREVIIVNDAGTDADSTAANTYSRAVYSNIDKQAADSLAITWNWKYLGA
jgi:hypothetical protein